MQNYKNDSFGKVALAQWDLKHIVLWLRYTLIVFLFSLVYPTAAFASGYAEFSAGYTRYDSSLLKDTASSLVRLGTPVTGSDWEDIMSLEIGFVYLGRAESNEESLEYRYQTNGITLGLRAHYSFSHQLQSFSRFGIFFYESAMDAPWLDSWRYSQGQDLYITVGLSIPVKKNWYLGTELMRYRVHRIDPVVYSVVVGVNF
ncbi:hypothetical protein [Desulfurispira natronophila]|uniref:Outer membrane protein OmpA-like transmembrane domain-containing protein n=1 Tax=Desulfurispira natronophila TaxID=682562 RepID=A0A7W7Y2I5_9BACT|nr:hypothetical protein [Desulfurispira natronophila]MBB5020872.1 hypothetical protein [Desulfurispira natronophila]